MTEAEWLTCSDPQSMLEYLRGRVDERTLLRFGCACCRSIWPMLGDERSRRVVEIAELLVAGRATREQLEATAQAAPYYEGHLAGTGIHIFACDAAASLGCPDAWWAARGAAEDARIAIREAPFMENDPDPAEYIDAHAAAEAEARKQADLLREIVGNPFPPEGLARQGV
jgi:hypothetical protein